MKRLLIVSIALTVLLCACRRTTPEETTEAIITEPTTATVLIEQTKPPVNTTFEDVKVETPDIASGVDVKYEVLEIEDEELQAILDKRSEEILARYIPNISSIAELGGTAEYNVKLESTYKSGNILSAVFSGNYAIYYENSEEGGEVVYTVNIDTATGKILETPDIVDYEKMVETFANGFFDISLDFSQYNSAYGIYPYVYLDDSRLTVCVTKSGMYEEVLRYSISYSDAADFIRIEE